MSQTLQNAGGCCPTPCTDPIVEQIPGPQGPAGANGSDGADGQSAYTLTTSNFTQPAVDANVAVAVVNSDWLSVGEDAFVSNGGYYLVVAKPTATSLTLKNLGYNANASPGATVAGGSSVSAAGEKGEPGENGTSPTIPLTTKGDLLGYDSAPARLGVGSDGQVPAADSAQVLGLNYVTIQPNAADDNSVPRFNGTTGKPVPTQTSKVIITDDGAIQASGSGGNARGARAVDLQVQRSDVTRVASGAEAFIGAGNNNTASGADSVVVGGSGNEASDDYVSVGGGGNNRATNRVSTIPGGFNGFCDLYGQMAHASGGFVQLGDAQTSEVQLRATTVNDTPTELFLDGAGASERMVQRDVVVWAFHGMAVGVQSAAGITAASWKFEGMFSRSATGEELFETVTLIAATADAISDGWGITGAITISYDAGNDSLKIEVTGAVATTIRWTAWLRLVEISRVAVP